MIRIVCRLLVFICLLAGVVEGATSITGTKGMGSRVRERTRLFTKTLLPDTTLYRCCSDAIVQTSVECGGLEKTYRFVTAAGDPWYPLPDTVVKVLFASVHGTGGAIYALKAWYPQFWDVFKLDEFSDASENQTPIAYSIWADTVEMIPVPKRIDTVVMKCYIEHAPIDTLAADSLIRLPKPYVLAAVSLACHYVCISAQLWDEADKFLALYEKQKAELIQIYTRRFDVLPEGKTQ